MALANHTNSEQLPIEIQETEEELQSGEEETVSDKLSASVKNMTSSVSDWFSAIDMSGARATASASAGGALDTTRTSLSVLGGSIKGGIGRIDSFGIMNKASKHMTSLKVAAVSAVGGTTASGGDIETGEGIEEQDPLVTSGSLPGLSSDVATGAQSSWASISRSDRFKGFLGLLVLSWFFFTMSTFFLPVVLLFPAKFALSFTLGSMCFMGAFVLIQGPTTWLVSVCSRERIPFTAAYFGSMAGTLLSCVWWKSYLLVVAFSVVQIVALAWYGVTYIPGGRYGMKYVGQALWQFARMCTKGCWACLSRLS